MSVPKRTSLTTGTNGRWFSILCRDKVFLLISPPILLGQPAIDFALAGVVFPHVDAANQEKEEQE
jgi:hypothetical protein